MGNPLANGIGSGMWAIAIAKVKLTAVYLTIRTRSSDPSRRAFSISWTDANRVCRN
jgi:hypothetical protein